MRIFLLYFCLLFTSTVFSTDWKNIEGIYTVTPEGYLDPSEGEARDTHYRIQLKGQSAMDLYTAMKVDPVEDECTGGRAKNIEEMQCLFFKEENTYECHFSIDIANQEIGYGVAC